jgi:hypothetical protein
MMLRLRHVCSVIILVFIAGPSHAGQREAIGNLDFETFRIDLLPFEFTVSGYGLTQCERDRYSDIDVIEARIEKPDGESWAHVYQMLPPADGGSVSCAAAELNVHEYCYRLPSHASKACGAMSYDGSSIEVYRAKPDQNVPPEHLYATIDGTLVVFAFDDKITWEESGQVLDAIESMARVTPSDLLSYRPAGANARRLRMFRKRASTPKEHVDRIPFSKLLPRPRPNGFDHVQGYVYWNKYGVEFQTNRSGESSQLRIQFSETARMPGLKTCWSERDCDLVATTSKGRKIYATKTNIGSRRRVRNAREYYVDMEGTLVFLSWPHWEKIEGRKVTRSHEFASSELETLIDSLEIATSSGLVRFPNMSIMGSYGGTVRSAFSDRRVMQKSAPAIVMMDTAPVKTDCIRVLEDGSTEVVGNMNMRMGQSGPRRCDP